MTIVLENTKPPRKDFGLIIEMVSSGSRVLDVGCGCGDLLHNLVLSRSIDGRGLEIDQKLVNKAVSRGLSVIQGDANTALYAYSSGIFDFVILSQTLQAMKQPREILSRLSEIGRYVIVSFPNFGYWRFGLSLLLRGRMPVSDILPYAWYKTPNIHLCTIVDFYDLCLECKIEIVHAYAISATNKVRKLKSRYSRILTIDNLSSPHAVFMLRKKKSKVFSKV